MVTQVTPVLRSEPQEQFSAKFEQFMTDFATIVDEINAAAAAYALSINSTSSTSETIGTGSKTFTIGTGLGHVVGMAVRYAFDDTNYMDGIVVSYNSGTGEEVVNFSSSTGSGTYTAWNISLGSTGDFVSKAGGSFTGDISVPVDSYDQASWDSNNEVPTKNDVRDEIESVKASIPSNEVPVGDGQTWQDVSASRAHSTTYTNSTGQAIQVFIAVTNSSTREVEVDGVSVGYFASADAAPSTSFIVPDGSSYEINGSVSTILVWSELR